MFNLTLYGVIIWFIFLFIVSNTWKYEFIEFKIRGGGGGGSKTTTTYHFTYAISETQIFERSTIVWEQKLGNIILIGDGSTTTASIPNSWLKKFYLAEGSGYKKIYPDEIKLYKNDLDTELELNTDYTYDNSTGEITFLSIPQDGDLIAGTWTYDPSRPEQTTVYADFSQGDLIKRVGFRPYKYEDEGLSDYESCCEKANDLLEELHKAIYPGNISAIVNPQIEIGQSILIKDENTGINNIYFIESFTERCENGKEYLDIKAISFPEDAYEITGNVLFDYSYKFELLLPQFMVNFIEEEDPDTTPDLAYHDDVIYFIAKVYNSAQEIDPYYSDSTKIKIKIPYVSPSKTRTFHNTEYINTEDLYPKNGLISQGFDISFHHHANGEYTDSSGDIFNDYFTEFSDANTFFSKKLCTFKIYDVTVPEFYHTVQQHMYIGRKPIKYEVSGNTDSGYPLPRRIIPYSRASHIVFIDKDDYLWLCDSRFVTEKLGNAVDSDLGKIPEVLTTDSRIIGMFSLGSGSWRLKYWSMSSDTWVNIGDVSLQANLGDDGTERHYKPFTPKVDSSGHNILMVTGEGSGVGFKKQAILLKGNTPSVANIADGSSKFACAPIIFDDKIYVDEKGRNKSTYAEEENISDNITFPHSSIRLYYFTDTTKSTLYAIYDQWGASDDFHTAGDANRNWFTILRRSATGTWSRVGTWYQPDSTTLWFYPLYAIGNKIAIFLRGSAVNSWYGISTSGTERKALGIIDMSKGLMNLIALNENCHYSGDYDVYGTEKFTIWFNNMVLWNWCDYSNIIRDIDHFQVQVAKGADK